MVSRSGRRLRLQLLHLYQHQAHHPLHQPLGIANFVIAVIIIDSYFSVVSFGCSPHNSTGVVVKHCVYLNLCCCGHFQIEGIILIKVSCCCVLSSAFF